MMRNTTKEFPSQKRATSQKTRSWAIQCVDGAEALALYSDETVRATRENKRINYDLYADKLDQTDVQRVLNPYRIGGIDEATSPAKMQNYPVSNPKVELLLGEESKRRLNYKVAVSNADAVSRKEEETKARIMEFLRNQVMAEEFDRAAAEAELKRLDRWRKYEFQDLRERMASQVLEYYTRKLKLGEKFNSGFLDALVAGEEIYCVDIMAGEPVVRKVNPMNLYVVRMGESPYIEDADIIVEEEYLPLGRVLDNYYDELTPAQVKALEERRSMGESAGARLLAYHDVGMPPVPNMVYESGSDSLLIEVGDGGVYGVGEPFDSDGNIRVVRAVWKSMRKLGIMEYEEDGTVFKKLVDENFKEDPQSGSKIKWVWISEWWEGTRLGEDVYVKLQPRPIQFRGLTNLSNCGSGYVGMVYNAVNSQGRSLMDRMKPYQYLYNVFMYRTELAFAKAKGRIGKMNLAKIPDGWSIEKWLYFAEQMGWAVEDPFKSGTEGVATGKLAGHMNESSATIDLEMGSYIQQHLQMLSFLENQMGQIAGVTRQREGMVDTRETVGGVERAVLQSATITETWFRAHDMVKIKVLETLLETAKYTLRNDKVKLQMVMDDMSAAVFEVDGAQLNEAEYGIFVSDASEDKELHQALKQLSQAAMQNDKVTLSGIVDIYTTSSSAVLGAKLRTMEEEFNARMKEAQEMQNQGALQQIEANRQARMEELVMQHEHEYSMKLLELEIAGSAQADPAKLADLELKREKMLKDYQVKMDQLKETIRSNREGERLEERKIGVMASRPKPTAK